MSLGGTVRFGLLPLLHSLGGSIAGCLGRIVYFVSRGELDFSEHVAVHGGAE